MRWLALSVDADVEAVEAVSEILGRVGRGSVIEPLALVADAVDEQALRPDPAAGYRVTAYVPDDADAVAAVDRTERALWHLQAFDLRPMSALAVTSVDDADWATAWRDGYEPIRIGRITIVPSWFDTPIDAELVVRLDPGMAFGTGLHPTTRACLEVMGAVGPMPEAVLDVGCGSGILAIAALRLGARAASACDVDPLALDACAANARANGVDDRLRVEGATCNPGRTFDLVIANILSGTLIALAPELADRTRPGGTLLLSGVLREQAADVIEAFSGWFEMDVRSTANDWLLLEGIRRGGRGHEGSAASCDRRPPTVATSTTMPGGRLSEAADPSCPRPPRRNRRRNPRSPGHWTL
jgi:ribosomal protein L11 methyltransferase